jgi:hypothetical protein
MKWPEFHARYIELEARLEHCTISHPDFEPLMLRLADICLPHQSWIDTTIDPTPPEPLPAWRRRTRSTRLYYHDRGLVKIGVWVPEQGRKALLQLGSDLRALSL